MTPFIDCFTSEGLPWGCRGSLLASASVSISAIFVGTKDEYVLCLLESRKTLRMIKLGKVPQASPQTRDILGDEPVHDALEYLDIDLPAEVQAYGLPNAIFSTTECGGSAIIYSFQGHLIPSIGIAGQLRSAAMMAAMETAVQPDFSAVIRLLPMEAVVSCKVQIIPNSLSESDDSKSTQSTGVIAVLTTLGRILGFVVRENGLEALFEKQPQAPNSRYLSFIWAGPVILAASDSHIEYITVYGNGGVLCTLCSAQLDASIAGAWPDRIAFAYTNLEGEVNISVRPVGLVEPLVLGWLDIGHYYITERKDDLNSADENAGFAIQIVAAVFDTFDSQRISSGAVKMFIDSMTKLLNLLTPKPEESTDSEWPLLQHTVRGLMYQTSLNPPTKLWTFCNAHMFEDFLDTAIRAWEKSLDYPHMNVQHKQFFMLLAKVAAFIGNYGIALTAMAAASQYYYMFKYLKTLELESSNYVSLMEMVLDDIRSYIGETIPGQRLTNPPWDLSLSMGSRYLKKTIYAGNMASEEISKFSLPTSASLSPSEGIEPDDADVHTQRIAKWRAKVVSADGSLTVSPKKSLLDISSNAITQAMEQRPEIKELQDFSADFYVQQSSSASRQRISLLFPESAEIALGLETPLKLEDNEAEDDTKVSGANNSFSAFNLPTKSAAERLVAREKKKEQKSEAGASNVESPYNSNTAVNMSLPSQPVVQAPAETKPVEEATQEASKQRVDSFEASFFNAPPPPAKEEAEEDEDEFDSFFIKSPDQRAPSFSGMSQAEPDGDDSDNWKWSEDSPGTSSTVNNTVANEPELFPEASQASSAVTEPESQLMHQSSFAGSISGGTAGGGDDEDDDSDSDGFVEAKPGRSRSKRKIKVVIKEKPVGETSSGSQRLAPLKFSLSGPQKSGGSKTQSGTTTDFSRKGGDEEVNSPFKRGLAPPKAKPNNRTSKDFSSLDE